MKGLTQILASLGLWRRQGSCVTSSFWYRKTFDSFTQHTLQLKSGENYIYFVSFLNHFSVVRVRVNGVLMRCPKHTQKHKLNIEPLNSLIVFYFTEVYRIPICFKIVFSALTFNISDQARTLINQVLLVHLSSYISITRYRLSDNFLCIGNLTTK